MLRFIYSIEEQIRSFPWTKPSWSLFIILFWIGFSALYTIMGKGKILSALVSVYISRLVLMQAPVIREYALRHIPDSGVSFIDLGLFIILFSFVFFCFSRFVFKTALDSRSVKSIIFSSAFAFLQTGLLISSVIAFLPLHVRAKIDPLLHSIFIGGPQDIFWLITPLLMLIILGSRLSDDHHS